VGVVPPNRPAQANNDPRPAQPPEKALTRVANISLPAPLGTPPNGYKNFTADRLGSRIQRPAQKREEMSHYED
jgi:hypothetical protein